MRKTSKILSVVFAIMLIFTSPSYSYEINRTKPLADKSQVVQFLKDRNTSKKMLGCVNYIYSYSKEVGIDPTIVIAISSIETGYGKSHLFKAYNNPGGVKAKRGWAKFKTIKAGYRYMIRLLATYSGKVNKKSWIYGKAKTTQQLGNYYWVENGCDRGYHNMLTKQIKKILSYPVKKTVKKTIKTQKPNKPKPIIEADKKTGLDLIKERINRAREGYGMNLIWNALNKR